MNFFKSIFKRFSKINDSYIFHDFLSVKECDEILEILSRYPFNNAKQMNLGRNNKEIFVNNMEIEKIFKSQISSFNMDSLKVVDLSLPLEFYRYDVGDFITKHTDAPRILRDKIESNFTAIVYLNDNFTGGETFFSKTGERIIPVKGSLLLFKHELSHEALIVSSGTKYIYRANWLLKR